MIYALSFVEVGIYWVSHYCMVDDVEQVSQGPLWAKLRSLFTLSLIPFGTARVGERGLQSAIPDADSEHTANAPVQSIHEHSGSRTAGTHEFGVEPLSR